MLACLCRVTITREMDRERKFHISRFEGFIAGTSGLLIGLGVGAQIIASAPPEASIKVIIEALSIAGVGALFQTKREEKEFMDDLARERRESQK